MLYTIYSRIKSFTLLKRYHFLSVVSIMMFLKYSIQCGKTKNKRFSSIKILEEKQTIPKAYEQTL